MKQGHGHHGHGHHPAPQSTRRRKAGPGLGLYIGGGVVVVGAAFLIGVLSREKRSVVQANTHGSAFDVPALSEQAERAVAREAAPAPAEPAAAPAQPMSVVLPVPLNRSEEPRRSVDPGKIPVVTAKAVKWARTHKVFAAFMKAPARYLAGKSARLSSPAALKAFLADPKQVNAYLDSPLVRIGLNSPVITRAIVSDPGVIKAFLGSPAMQDPSAVRALLASALFKKVMDCPGPQGILEEPGTLTRALTNPDMVRWMGENPSAMKGLAGAAPALAAAMPPAAPKKKR